MTGSVQFTKDGKRTNYTLHIMQLLPGGQMKDIGSYKPPDAEDQGMSLFLDPIPQPRAEIDMDSWKHKVLNVTSIKASRIYNMFNRISFSS